MVSDARICEIAGELIAIVSAAKLHPTMKEETITWGPSEAPSDGKRYPLNDLAAHFDQLASRIEGRSGRPL